MILSWSWICLKVRLKFQLRVWKDGIFASATLLHRISATARMNWGISLPKHIAWYCNWCWFCHGGPWDINTVQQWHLFVDSSKLRAECQGCTSPPTEMSIHQCLQLVLSTWEVIWQLETSLNKYWLGKIFLAYLWGLEIDRTYSACNLVALRTAVCSWMTQQGQKSLRKKLAEENHWYRERKLWHISRWLIQNKFT